MATIIRQSYIDKIERYLGKETSVAALQSGHDFHKMRIKIWQLLLVNHCLLFLSYNMAFCQETM